MARDLGESIFLSGLVGLGFSLFDQWLLHLGPASQPLVDLPVQWGAWAIAIALSVVFGALLTLILRAVAPLRILGPAPRLASAAVWAFWLSVLAMSASRVSLLIGGLVLIATPLAAIGMMGLMRALESAADVRPARAVVALIAVCLPAQLVTSLFSLLRVHPVPAWLPGAEVAALLASLGIASGIALVCGLRLGARPGNPRWMVVPSVLLCVALLPAWLRATPNASQLDSPNLILIVLDAMRRDHVGLYDSRARTPAIDAFFSDALVFDNAFSSAGWTLPSMLSVFSGKHPRLTLKRYLPIHSIEPQISTLAERLRDRGYATGAFVTNVLLGPQTGALRGFQQRLLANHHLRRGQLQAGPPLAAACWNHLSAWLNPHQPFSDTTRIALEETDRFLDRHGDQSFFAWIHLTSPHDPYNPDGSLRDEGDFGRLRPGYFAPQHEFPSTEDLREGRFIPTESEKRHIAQLYRGEVEQLDRELAGLFESLEARGLLESTVVVLTSDHGEEFWDHGAYNHDHSLYAELTSVPLLIRAPGHSGRRVSNIASLIDLDSTLASLLGLPPREDSDGVDLLTSEESRIAFSVDHALHLYAARDPRYSAVWDGLRDQLRLFDRTRDPAEQHDIAQTLPDVANHYRGLLGAYREELETRARTRPGPADIDPDTLRRLQELGYARSVPSANPPVSAEAP